MSTSAAALLPEPQRFPESIPERRLRALERPKRRAPRLTYALAAVLAVAAIAGGQVALSLATTQDAFVLDDLRSQHRELNLQAQGLQAEVTGLSSPQYLAANADAAGMVLSGVPALLRLSDAAIVGEALSATRSSTVRPNQFPYIGNALVADTPLVTRPSATIEGTIVAKPVVPADADKEAVVEEAAVPAPPPLVVNHPGNSALPPVLAEGGLPSPVTR